MVCKQEHRYDDRFIDLDENHGGSGRHKCAGCAYDVGFSHGELGVDPQDINLLTLRDSQAGTVRHKDPYQAYSLGYADGKIKRKETLKSPIRPRDKLDQT